MWWGWLYVNDTLDIEWIRVISSPNVR